MSVLKFIEEDLAKLHNLKIELILLKEKIVTSYVMQKNIVNILNKINTHKIKQKLLCEVRVKFGNNVNQYVILDYTIIELKKYENPK